MRKGFHRLAVVESAAVGKETRVWAFAHVMKGARVGARCNLGEGVFVESGVVLGDDVTVKNGVALYDGVTVADEAFVGPHAVFTNDLRPRSGRFKRPPSKFAATRVGPGATIGANATIVCGHDIGALRDGRCRRGGHERRPPHALVAGVPARRIGFVCACGETLPRSLRCSCRRRYRRLGAGLVAVAVRRPTSR